MEQTTIPEAHEFKYKNFLKMIANAKENKIREVVIVNPWVLGDNYEEVMLNISLIAEAGLSLVIMEGKAK
jgi:collagenase-like PrtC family protease